MSFAAVRPDDWNLPLLLHVAGAMALVSLLAAVAVLLVVALRSDDKAPALRFTFRTLLYGAIPAYVVMRGAAEWVASKEDVPEDVSWIGIGYSISDGGLLLLIVVTVLAGMGSRRAARGEQPTGLLRSARVLTLLLIVAYAVALWAMATKPA